jgi:hypothetical protein
MVFHLIFQTLPFLGAAGVGTCGEKPWLPRYQRAGPSTSLDELFNQTNIITFEGGSQFKRRGMVSGEWGMVD